jgi:hypothetical protein
VWKCGEARWLDIIKGNLTAQMLPQIGHSWSEVWFTYSQEPVLFLTAVQQPASETGLSTVRRQNPEERRFCSFVGDL